MNSFPRVSLGSSQWENSIVSAHAHHNLDRPAQTEIYFALKTKDRNNLSLKDIPKTLTLELMDRPFFKGELLQFENLSSSLTKVTYTDGLFLAKKRFENTFLKGMALSELLSTLSSKIGLSAKFVGDFSHSQPMTDLSGKSIAQHLEDLSHSKGFFFCFRPSQNALYFFRLNEFISQSSVNFSKNGIYYRHLDNLDEIYQSHELQVYDPENLNAKNLKQEHSSFYSNWTNSPSFRDKMSLPLAQGVAAHQSHEPGLFEQSQNEFTQRLAKAAIAHSGAQVEVSLRNVACFPGDQLSLSEVPYRPGKTTTCLVQSVGLQFRGSQSSVCVLGVQL